MFRKDEASNAKSASTSNEDKDEETVRPRPHWLDKLWQMPYKKTSDDDEFEDESEEEDAGLLSAASPDSGSTHGLCNLPKAAECSTGTGRPSAKTGQSPINRCSSDESMAAIVSRGGHAQSELDSLRANRATPQRAVPTKSKGTKQSGSDNWDTESEIENESSGYLGLGSKQVYLPSPGETPRRPDKFAIINNCYDFEEFLHRQRTPLTYKIKEMEHYSIQLKQIDSTLLEIKKQKTVFGNGNPVAENGSKGRVAPKPKIMTWGDCIEMPDDDEVVKGCIDFEEFLQIERQGFLNKYKERKKYIIQLKRVNASLSEVMKLRELFEGDMNAAPPTSGSTSKMSRAISVLQARY